MRSQNEIGLDDLVNTHTAVSQCWARVHSTRWPTILAPWLTAVWSLAVSLPLVPQFPHLKWDDSGNFTGLL